MAKSSFQALLPLIAAIGFVSFLGFAFCEENLTVEGMVYCDTCRAAFVTKASTPISGATVKLTCKNRVGGDVTLTQEGTSDETGTYKIPVEGDHEEEICEVTLVKSPVEGCNTIAPGLDSARVLITQNNGITGTSRFVNALGFLKKEPLKECPQILKAMGLIPQMIPTE